MTKQINIDVSYKQLHRVPFIVLPHFVSDLPIYLLWGQDPTTEHMIFPHVRRYASRLIFDSDCTQNLQRFSKMILEELHHKNLEIRDINWASTGSWRDVLGRTFDTPEKIHQLHFSKNIQIIFNNHKTEVITHPEIQAIYVQGWIAAQMGWQFKSIENRPESRRIIYNTGSNDAVVTLLPQIHHNIPPGTILSFEAASYDDHFIVSRKEDQPKVVIHISSLEQCEMPFTLSLPDLRKGPAFLQELFYRKTSVHYQNMLKLIGQYNCQDFNTAVNK